MKKAIDEVAALIIKDDKIFLVKIINCQKSTDLAKLFVILHHITNIYSVTLVSGVYKNMGNSAYKFTVHNNRTAAHTLNNTARFIK